MDLDASLVGATNMRKHRTSSTHRSGMSMLLCLFTLSLTSMILVGMLGSQTIQLSAHRNVADYERALYLAGAGAHHALTEIENNSSWLGTIPSTEFPAGSGTTYSAVAVTGAGGTVVVTGTGVAGDVTRRIQVTILPGS